MKKGVLRLLIWKNIRSNGSHTIKEKEVEENWRAHIGGEQKELIEAIR